MLYNVDKYFWLHCKCHSFGYIYENVSIISIFICKYSLALLASLELFALYCFLFLLSCSLNFWAPVTYLSSRTELWTPKWEADKSLHDDINPDWNARKAQRRKKAIPVLAIEVDTSPLRFQTFWVLPKKQIWQGSYPYSEICQGGKRFLIKKKKRQTDWLSCFEFVFDILYVGQHNKVRMLCFDISPMKFSTCSFGILFPLCTNTFIESSS